MSRVSYTEEQRDIQKARRCTLATVDIDTPQGRMTWQGPLNDAGYKRVCAMMNELIAKQRKFRP